MSYTLLKMCFAYEVNAVMECGKHGGSQRWQLTIIHLSFGERKLYTKEVEPCRNAGLLLYEGKMEIIQECAQNFKRFLGSPIFLFSFFAVSLVHVQEIIAESSIVKFCPMFSKIFTALGLISYIH